MLRFLKNQVWVQLLSIIHGFVSTHICGSASLMMENKSYNRKGKLPEKAVCTCTHAVLKQIVQSATRVYLVLNYDLSSRDSILDSALSSSHTYRATYATYFLLYSTRKESSQSSHPAHMTEHPKQINPCRPKGNQRENEFRLLKCYG